MRPVAVALVHYPVLDRQCAVVTTAITNLDLHDIARSAYTYGASDFFVTHPISAQRELARRVKEHWVNGSGARRIPDRRAPMTMLRIVETLDEAVNQLSSDGRVELWATSARGGGQRPLSHQSARGHMHRTGPPILLVFGTGWGLADEIAARAHWHLEPIGSPRSDGYNHLSVRAAAAILLDRLLGGGSSVHEGL